MSRVRMLALAGPALVFALVFAVPAASAPTDSLRIEPPSPCVSDSVVLAFTLCSCNDQLLDAQRLDAEHVRIDIRSNPWIVCVWCGPVTHRLLLGHYPAGPHKLDALVVSHIALPDSSDSLVIQHHTVAFDVSPVCAPPPPGPLPHVDAITIGRGPPCDGCPPVACAFDSIPIGLRGHFEDDCIQLDEVRVTPNPSLTPIPQPDIVQIIYRINSCLRRACQVGTFPWERMVRIGGLRPTVYGLNVQAYLRDECFPGTLTPLGSTLEPFVVDLPCSVSTPGCYLASFEHTQGICDAYVGPDHPGEAVFEVASGTRVAGVQGRLRFARPGLRITAIEALPAGALLNWRPASDGATFIVVVPNPADSTDRQPFLRVHVATVPGVPFDGLVRLVPEELLVSDANGDQLQMCPVTSLRLMEPAARFCPEQGCDFNGDFHADVRDLVLMVRCLQTPTEACTTGVAQLDCDGDGDRDLDDVLCCARVILGGSRPDSAGARPAPWVTVNFGTPAPVNGGLDVPVTLEGAYTVGAAKLSFEYPAEVFESASIDLVSGSNWLTLNQAGDGHLVLGAIQFFSTGVRPDGTMVLGPVTFTLHLRLRAGQTVAGTLQFTAGDFADFDGVTLVTAATPVTLALAGQPHVAVSAARPNPFASETRFTVMLTQDADLEVAVYDLLGRKVATLFKGRAPAGSREFVWRRVRDDGAAAPTGIYFYRAASGGGVAREKLLVLPRN